MAARLMKGPNQRHLKGGGFVQRSSGGLTNREDLTSKLVMKWLVIHGLNFTYLQMGIYWGYNSLILTIDPIFLVSLQVWVNQQTN